MKMKNKKFLWRVHALKKVPSRPQLEEPGHMGVSLRGQELKLDEVSQFHLSHLESPISPVLWPWPLILKEEVCDLISVTLFP